MVNYKNGKIYQIISNDGKMIYVGHTTSDLSYRMRNHKNKYSQWKLKKYRNTKSFEIFEKYGFENCRIELLEDYPCDRLEQLKAREGYWQRNIDCINARIEGRTQKERDETEKYKEMRKKYSKSQKRKNVCNKYYNKKKFNQVLDELLICFPEIN